MEFMQNNWLWIFLVVFFAWMNASGRAVAAQDGMGMISGRKDRSVSVSRQRKGAKLAGRR